MSAIYPAIEPYDHGFMDTGDGHQIYWECCGNPDGKPALVLHGGPGTGCSAIWRRFFNPQAYRIIIFDQRNCGRSLPHASDLSVDLSTNTTQHLLHDIERLREHLNIETCLLFGASWGTTLGLLYAETYPDSVSECVFFGVTTGRQEEIDWLCHDIAPMFPEEWDSFVNAVPEGSLKTTMVETYYHLLNDANPKIVIQAAQDWHDWDTASIPAEGKIRKTPDSDELNFQIARSRIVTHYFYHACFLENDEILRQAHKLNGIPGILVQGRLDVQAPLKTAWELSKIWQDCELILVENAGHSFADSGMGTALVSATNRFAGL